MLQQRDVARDDRRRGEAKDLPKREIPRHDGEHWAERVEGDVTTRRLRRDRLRREHPRGVLGIVATAGGAFRHFRARIDEQLSHLVGDETRIDVAARIQEIGDAREHIGASRDRHGAPAAVSLDGAAEARVDLVGT